MSHLFGCTKCGIGIPTRMAVANKGLCDPCKEDAEQPRCKNCGMPIYLHASGWTHGCGIVLCDSAHEFLFAEPRSAA